MKKILFLVLMSITTITYADQIAHVNVNGMVCDFCARGIEKTFMKDKQVKKVDVNLKAGKVLITYSKDAKISFNDIKEKITANGQTAIDMNILRRE